MRNWKNQLLAFGLVCGQVQAQRLAPTIIGSDPDNVINAHIPYNNGIILAGEIRSLGSTEVNNVAFWDGTAITSMGSGFGSLINGVEAIGYHDNTPVITGQDGTLGHIAAWNGTNWEQLGNGLPGRGRTLLSTDLGLFAGGEFNGVRSLQGGTWSLFGSSSIGMVSSIVEFEDRLYASSNTAPYLFTFEGDWVPASGGLNGQVTCMLNHNGRLYIGGSFTSTADASQLLARVCSYDGVTFSSLQLDQQLGHISRIIPGFGADLIVTHSTGSRECSVISESSVVRLASGTATSTFTFQGNFYLTGTISQIDQLELGGLAMFASGSITGELDVNGVQTMYSPGLDFFRTSIYGNTLGTSQFPRNSGLTTIFSAKPILAGVVNGALSVTSISDEPERYYQGPLAENYDALYGTRYGQLWEVTSDQIQHHQDNFSDLDYTMPTAIRTWPANGITENGEPTSIAPFFDQNGNGVYEPSLGDHPSIRGDKAVYYILHDQEASGEQPGLGVDIHIMHYAFVNSWDAYLASTVFTNIKYVNRTQTTYTNIMAGIYMDLDIGYWADDVVGCDTTLELAYGFNRDPVDSSPVPFNTYGDHPPAQGLTFLSTSLDAHVCWDGRGLPGFEAPSVPGAIFNRMRGRSSSGSPVLDDSGNQTPHMFSGDPITGSGWVDLPGPVQSLYSSDQKQLASTWFPDLHPGDTICLDLAFVFARDISGDHLSSVTRLKERVDSLRTWWFSEQRTCTGGYDWVTSQPEKLASEDRMALFPVPASNRIWLDLPDVFESLTIRVLSSDGRMVRGPFARHHRRMEVDLSGLPSGLYLMQATGPQHQYTERFIVD